MGFTVLDGRLGGQSAKFILSPECVEIESSQDHHEIPRSRIIALFSNPASFGIQHLYYVKTSSKSRIEQGDHRPTPAELELASLSISGLSAPVLNQLSIKKLPSHLLVPPKDG